MKNLETECLCPVCQSKTHLFQSKLFDDRHAFPGSFKVFRCERCGHGTIIPSPGEVELAEIYTRYYPRKSLTPDFVRSLARYRGTLIQQIAVFLKGLGINAHFHAKTGESVLDIGCGAGVSLLELENIGAIAYGSEYDRNVEPIAKTLSLKIHFGDLKTLPLPDHSLDCITLSQVLEHVTHPVEFLIQIRSKLKKTGRVVMAFPNIDGLSCRLAGRTWINWHVPYHLHFFTRASLEKVLAEAGFELRSLRTVTPTEWFKLQIMDLLNPPKPGIPNPTWNPQASHSWQFLFFRKLSTATAYLFIPLLRLIDLFGIGDSFLIEVSPLNGQSSKTFYPT